MHNVGRTVLTRIRTEQTETEAEAETEQRSVGGKGNEAMSYIKVTRLIADKAANEDIG